jgi:hypothetical protein
MPSNDLQELIAEVLENADDETKVVIADVFKVEREKLYQTNPYGVKDEILAVVKDAVT